MNLALPPDNDWRYIAELTGDDSWLPEKMRKYFAELERNQYLPDGVPGHGYDGYVEVCIRLAPSLSTLYSDTSPEQPEQYHLCGASCWSVVCGAGSYPNSARR